MWTKSISTMRVIVTLLLTVAINTDIFSQVVNNEIHNFTLEQEKIIGESYYRDSVPVNVYRLSDNNLDNYGLYVCRGMGPHFYEQLFIIYNDSIIFFKHPSTAPKTIIGNLCKIIIDNNINAGEIRLFLYRDIYNYIIEDSKRRKEIDKHRKHGDFIEYSDNDTISDKGILINSQKVDDIYTELICKPESIPYELPWYMLIDLTPEETIVLLGKLQDKQR